MLAIGVVWGLPLVGRSLAPAPDPTALPPPARSVAIGDGLALNVREVGSGDAIVLVHGLPSNIGDWASVPDALAALGHRVVVYDRVGYGHSSRAADAADYSLPVNARRLGELLDALGIERASLVGWSYGGGIVQTFAVDHPERVVALVLLGSVGPISARRAGDDPLESLARSPIGPVLFRWLVSIPQLAAPALEDGLAAAFSGPEKIPAGFEQRAQAQMAMPGTIDAWLEEGRHGGYETLRPESIAAPTLVLHGADDHAVAPVVAEDLAKRLPNAELNLVQGGSHMLPVTHPDRVAARIHEWVSVR